MVEIIKGYDDDKVTQETFLSSIKSWYNEKGIHCGVEKVYTTVKDGNFGKYTLLTLKCSILEDMKKCRARVIGEDGKVVMTEDKMGNEIEEIEEISNPEEVTFFLFCPHDNENENVLICKESSALADFIIPVFISSGELPAGFNGGVRFTEEELLEALEGYECYIKYGKNKRAKKPHPVAVNL